MNLAWITISPHLLKTFTANHVSEIFSFTDSDKWFHVGSKQNTMDLPTRGVDPSLLTSSELW